MIQKPSFARSRTLKLLLGVTLGVAVVLTLILLFIPEKEGRSAETQGVLLFPDGESRSCTVTLQGAVKTYAFDPNAPIYDGTLSIDGEEVGDLRLTFSGSYAEAGEAGTKAVMTQEMELAAQISVDGRDCLVLAPAPDEETAQTLLSQFLAFSYYARQQGWEAFRTE